MALLTLLALLAILSKLLLHLLLELLRLALQHLLLPFLLGGLGPLRCCWARSSSRLASSSSFFSASSISCAFCSAVVAAVCRVSYWFFSVSSSRSKRRPDRAPRRPPAASTPAARSERNLNLPEGGFGAQQELQSLLLVGDGVLPLLLLQLLRGRRHGGGGGDHILLEVADGLHFIGQLARLQAAGKRDGLIVQGGLRLRQQLGDVGGLLLGRVLVALLFEGGGDDFLLPLRDLRGLIASAPASTAASAARLLRLRKLALKRVGLDEHHVGVGFGVGVLGGGVDAHQIARNQLEILQRKRGRAVGLLLRPFAAADPPWSRGRR